MKHSIKHLAAAIIVSFVTVAISTAAELHKTENVIFVMTDGLRWQEVFCGADASLLDNLDPCKKASLAKKFCRNSTDESRKTLMPFIWDVIAKDGQVYGNQSKHSCVKVTNAEWFSYPGYSETLCGFVDPRINRNDVGPNPNVTVLEWLHGKPAFRGRVAAFGAWATMNEIFNRERCGFCVNAGYEPLTENIHSEKVDVINQLKAEAPRTWGDVPFDTFAFHTALEYFKAKHPRVFYLELAETDDWGHAGRYDEYLTAASRADYYVKTLWDTAQTMPEYRGKTTLIFSPDHGRGVGSEKWRDHGKNAPGSEDIWLAVLGPDTPALGERADVPTVGMNQIAATLAALLGEDYCTHVPRAGKPIADVIKTIR